MPELPEVETIRRQLERMLVGQKIKRVRKLREKSWRGNKKEVERRRIVGVGRRAKVLVIELEGKSFLLIHLKLTGQLIWMKQSEKPGKHTRVVLELDKGRLFFNDMRVFGWIKVMDEEQMEEELSKFGPDVNSKKFTVGYLKEILGSSSRAVKLILLDQKKLGGVGNIYANEGLYCAGIDPRRSGKEVAKDEGGVRRLFKCLRRVIEQGIRYGGATASDENYINALGGQGGYQQHFLAYERKGKCRRCGEGMKKIKLGGRGTYFCPKCQK